MTYYRVPPKLDQKRYAKDRYFVIGELYTLGECKKYHIDPERLDAVEIKRNDTYWFFGCRFQHEKFGRNSYPEYTYL